MLSEDQVTFDSDAEGQVAMVIYEWRDVQYLGKVTSTVDGFPVSVLCHHGSGHVQANKHSRRRTFAQAVLSEMVFAIILSWDVSLLIFPRGCR